MIAKTQTLYGLCVFTLLVGFASCCSCPPKEETIEKMESFEPWMDSTWTPVTIPKYYDSAIRIGSTSAYSKLASRAFIEGDWDGLLSTAMIVANKYDNPDACYHVFTIFYHRNVGEEFETLDINSRKLAIYYLLKAYELNHSGAQYPLKELFHPDSIPSSASYLSCFETR